MSDFDQFKDTFIAECFELLTEMEERLSGIDSNPSSEELNAIFRCAHSIKGGSGAFGFTHITKFTHSLENCLDLMREGKIKIDQKITAILLKSADMLNKLVQAAQFGEEYPESFSQELRSEIDKIANLNLSNETKHETEEPKEEIDAISTYQINFIPDINLLSTGNEPLLLIRELETLGELTTTIDSSKIPLIENLNLTDCYLSFSFELKAKCAIDSIKEVFEFVEDNCKLEINLLHAETKQLETSIIPESKVEEHLPEIKTEGNKPAVQSSGTIRVELNKIDKLVNMVGELVITQSMLFSLTKNMSIENFPKIIRGIEELSQHSRELQESVMSVRMQPVKTIFLRMPRIVRDLAAQLNKQVKLTFQGENTEVDKTVIELLSDPLMHMIRNSVDHGIEKPETRIANGKNEVGTIKMSAFHHGGKIMIEISDDGQGINRERVLGKAIEKGLVDPDAKLTPEEIDKLIFLPGFSTAETISNISGRGVGMDVVKNNIEALGGVVKISNNPGLGAAITVALPLTLAILEGMIVRVVDENYIIPISNIIESLSIKQEDIGRVSNSSEVINLRGEFISVFGLADIFNIENIQEHSANRLVVLLETGEKKFGLIVDELLGQQQVVIKTLEPNTKPIAGISGATILGDGKVALIVDVDQLEELMFSKSSLN